MSHTDSTTAAAAPAPPATAASVSSGRYPSHAKLSRILVVGGNGYVGSHILKELANRCYTERLALGCMSRSGVEAPHSETWRHLVRWNKGDVSNADGEWKQQLQQYDVVISCVGGFGNIEQMKAINGTANCNLASAAQKAGVKRFIYISAHHYQLPAALQRGYYEGKKMGEECVTTQFGDNGFIIRPSFIYGSRYLRSLHTSLPLWLIGAPLQFLTSFKLVQKIPQLPVIGPILAPVLYPPVAVETVAKCATDIALHGWKQNIVEVPDMHLYYDH